MNTTARVAVLGFGVAGAVLFGAAGTATAAPVSGRADDAVHMLEGQGYVVQVSGSANAPLSACTVTNFRDDVTVGTPTAYLDVFCPTGC